ncbi:MAG: DUF3188 domain-containing protein [Cyanobium sp.]
MKPGLAADGGKAPPPAMGPASRRRALLALSSPLLILLALVALLHRPASDRIQALPALGIGIGLLTTSWQRRRQRRRELLRALRDRSGASR